MAATYTRDAELSAEDVPPPVTFEVNGYSESDLERIEGLEGMENPIYAVSVPPYNLGEFLEEEFSGSGNSSKGDFLFLEVKEETFTDETHEIGLEYEVDLKEETYELLKTVYDIMYDLEGESLRVNTDLNYDFQVDRSEGIDEVIECIESTAIPVSFKRANGNYRSAGYYTIVDNTTPPDSFGAGVLSMEGRETAAKICDKIADRIEEQTGIELD